MIKSIPKGYRALTPNFVFKDSRKAIAFYKKAFRAKELTMFNGADGQSVMHATIKIGNAIVMMSDERTGMPCESAETLGKSPISIYLYVKDADKTFNKAVKAGAVAVMPPEDMFWGDRMGAVKDPFGYSWTIATHTKDLTDEEVKQAGAVFMSSRPK